MGWNGLALLVSAVFTLVNSEVRVFDEAGHLLVLSSVGPVVIKFDPVGCEELCTQIDELWAVAAKHLPGKLWRAACADHPSVCARQAVSAGSAPVFVAWNGHEFQRYDGGKNLTELSKWIHQSVARETSEARASESQSTEDVWPGDDWGDEAEDDAHWNSAKVGDTRPDGRAGAAASISEFPVYRDISGDGGRVSIVYPISGQEIVRSKQAEIVVRVTVTRTEKSGPARLRLYVDHTVLIRSEELHVNGGRTTELQVSLSTKGMMDGAEHIVTALVESTTGDRLLAQDDVLFTTSKDLSFTASREQRRNFQLVWYFESGAWRKQTWLGVPIQKYSGDLITYQELLSTVQPRVLVEFGTGSGGSALYFAGVLHQLHANTQRACEGSSCHDGYRVFTVDQTLKRVFARARQVAQIEFMQSECTAKPVRERIVQLRAEYGGPFLFILDTDHHATQVLAELHLLHPILSAGDQIVVEHTYLDDGGEKPTSEFGGGPGKAIRAFLKEHPHQYVQDMTVGWKQVFTQADSGFIRRV